MADKNWDDELEPARAKTQHLIATVYCCSFVRDYVLRSVHVTNPAYLSYCRDLIGAMVCIKPPHGAQAVGGSLLEQVSRVCVCLAYPLLVVA